MKPWARWPPATGGKSECWCRSCTDTTSRPPRRTRCRQSSSCSKSRINCERPRPVAAVRVLNAYRGVLQDMLRRDFGKLSIAALASAVVAKEGEAADTRAPDTGAPADVHGVTAYVASFVVSTGYEAIPRDVIELGKKSILDGFGLALAGSRAET